ncbi:Cocaine esterase [Variovorax sp. PBL-H6]|uniref:CocE/NonD family hydrolase n=1 Tax=Variovorax sp. PBL-H6 TaxID=434009 RepID=UPI001319A139|nr:CocE/NonD family hydrolase [Variovorax sp. PBL-H6]VTU15116.1 Cocaine esterase [Variovorax sp. PBL-H6]
MHDTTFRTENRDAMLIDRDVPIEANDGLVLRADVFRPPEPGRYPVLLTYGPYAKGLAFQEGYPSSWNRMILDHPDVAYGSSNKHQSWEVVDPEKWVPHGYVCIRVDSRGCGRSPGFVDHFSPRETQDYFECIEWAAAQAWSNGRIGLSGVSYFGMNQWQVASLQPPHLAAMCIWEGASDFYRDASHHGGIVSTFWANWYDIQVKSVQNGLGDRGPVSRVTGETVCGPQTLGNEELQRNRCDFGEDILQHPLDDPWHRDRSAKWENIKTPFLSAGNWGGQGLHLRGNVEGFVRSASEQKWLEMHGLEHWTHFYTDYGIAIQRAFFDHFLKGQDNGWDKRPRVQLQVRSIEGFQERFEEAWPIPRTQWKRMHADLSSHALIDAAPGQRQTPLEFDALGDGITFISPPAQEECEITGPLSASLRISSTTTDADIFLVLRVFTPDMREVTFQGAIDPHTPIAQGWLRASHRKLDRKLSTDYRPYHSHDELQPLEPGVPVDLEVEILPTSIVVPAGYRIGFTIRGRDYEFAASTGARLGHFKNELKGCGPFLHDEPRDRPKKTVGGSVTVHSASVLLPTIP